MNERKHADAPPLESKGSHSQSNASFEAVFNSITDAVICTDTERRVTSINPATTAMFGYMPEELRGMTAEVLYADKADYEKQGKERYHTGSKSGSRLFEMKYRRKDGTVFLAESLGTEVRDALGNILGFVGIHRDITERKRLEEQLLQSQKMDAVGQMASGVAHDFNNILTSVSGYAEILSIKMKEGDPLRRYVTEIAAAGERGKKLIGSLLAFARKEEVALQPVNLNEIVKMTEELLLRLIPADIEFKATIADEPLPVMADITQLEQVFMNLSTNARDAMPDGGVLTISTDVVRSEEPFGVTGCQCKPGRYAVISVKDTGSGMDEELKKRIFEPFFTTKGQGKGTGLGLSMVYGIIDQHGGCIDIESGPGKGTTFKIYLPVIDMEIKKKEAERHAAHQNGRETILIADDERDIRASASSFLEEYGYRVIEAMNGDEALEKFMENKDSIHLVILDVVMPKKGGKMVFEEMKKVRPDVKAIFASGYGSEILEKKGIFEEEVNFMSKPFSPNDLLRTVRDMLDDN